jgi:hypothetical protein
LRPIGVHECCGSEGGLHVVCAKHTCGVQARDQAATNLLGTNVPRRLEHRRLPTARGNLALLRLRLPPLSHGAGTPTAHMPVASAYRPNVSGQNADGGV